MIGLVQSFSNGAPRKVAKGMNKWMLSVVLAGGLVLVGCKSDEGKSPKSSGSAAATIESCESMETGAAPKPQAVQAGTHWGPEFKLAEKDTVSIADVIAKPDDYNGKYLRVKGQVSDVCQVKGCWFTFGDPKAQESVFVKFSDPPTGRLIPLNAPGHEVIIEGNFKVAQISESFAKHLAGESGKPQVDAAKISGPQKKLMVTEPAVTIVGLSK